MTGRDELAARLAAVFDSQIAGGKRYDLAEQGRRRANATLLAPRQRRRGRAADLRRRPDPAGAQRRARPGHVRGRRHRPLPRRRHHRAPRLLPPARALTPPTHRPLHRLPPETGDGEERLRLAKMPGSATGGGVRSSSAGSWGSRAPSRATERVAVSRAKHRPSTGVEPAPAGGQHAQDVAVGEQGDVAVGAAGPARSRGRPGPRPRRWSRRPGSGRSRSSSPASCRRISVGGQALVVAVVPLGQVVARSRPGRRSPPGGRSRWRGSAG